MTSFVEQQSQYNGLFYRRAVYRKLLQELRKYMRSDIGPAQEKIEAAVYPTIVPEELIEEVYRELEGVVRLIEVALLAFEKTVLKPRKILKRPAKKVLKLSKSEKPVEKPVKKLLKKKSA